MKKAILFLLPVMVITVYTFYSCHSLAPHPEKAISEKLLSQIDSFSTAKDRLLHLAESNAPDEKQLQEQFMQTRYAYKRIEWATEYVSPIISRFVNGPPVQEVEMASGQVFEPAGLQVIEAILFPKYDASKKTELIAQVKKLQRGCDKYKQYFSNFDMFDWQVFDATKLEVFRVLALGISGFDDPLTLKSMQESDLCLKSVQGAIVQYANSDEADTINRQFAAAETYLEKNTDFIKFNRAEFIIKYGNPLTISISKLEKRLNIHVIHYRRLLNQEAQTLFDKNAFNVNAYAPLDSFTTGKKIALGRLLFSDPVLSGTQTRSCQSCHQPEKAFTDGFVKNTVITDNKRVIKRNTPTLLNASLQPSQFDDLRAQTLEDQAQTVIENKDEMHGSMQVAARRLWTNKTYRELFATIYPVKKRTAIDPHEIANALASYIRSLTALNSRFDDYMRGDRNALNAQEISGFNLFMGKAKCATCHYMPLFNGSFPPRYMIIESEVIGVPSSSAETAIDTDMGRYNIRRVDAFKHAFKISTVRNAALTAPYMHNGVFTTLNQVIDFYNKGGGAGIGYKVDNQTLDAGKLNLTKQEIGDVVAFIKSLNSR